MRANLALCFTRTEFNAKIWPVKLMSAPSGFGCCLFLVVGSVVVY